MVPIFHWQLTFHWALLHVQWILIDVPKPFTKDLIFKDSEHSVCGCETMYQFVLQLSALFLVIVVLSNHQHHYNVLSLGLKQSNMDIGSFSGVEQSVQLNRDLDPRLATVVAFAQS